MVGFFDKSQTQPPSKLYEAFNVLQFLAQAGNQAAERRLQDITQSCLHVWPDVAFNASSSPTHVILQRSGQSYTPTNGLQPQDSSLSSSGPSPCMAVNVDQGSHLDEAGLLEPISDMDIPDVMFDMHGAWDLDLSGEAEGIYSSFHNPTLPLTGVDYIDWLEIEKIIGGPE